MIKHPHEIEASSELINEIKNTITNASFDRMSRILYSTDASIYQMIPAGVVFPKNTEEICEIIKICHKHKMPVLPRGGGSSLAGQSIGYAIIIDHSKYLNNIVEIDLAAKQIVVQPGITLGIMNKKIAKHGLIYGPDPASGDRATLGGILANNATGAHSIVYGMSHDHVIDLEVICAKGKILKLCNEDNWEEEKRKGEYKGEIYRRIEKILDIYHKEIQINFPKTFRNVAGYNLKHLYNKKKLVSLLVGSEGTLGMISQAKLNLVKIPKKKALVIIQYGDIKAALESIPLILESAPSAIEIIDKFLLDLAKEHREFNPTKSIIHEKSGAILIVEYSGDSEKEVKAGVIRLKEKMKITRGGKSIKEIFDEHQQSQIWVIRKMGLGILMGMKGDSKPVSFIEDAAVPVENLSNYVEEVQRLSDSLGVNKIAVYGHASAGCLHIRPVINLKSAEGRKQLRMIAQESANLAVKYGGTVSGEHGDGISRSEFLKKIYGEELVQAFSKIKKVFDPDDLFNPGKIVNPYKMDDEALLRFGEGYNSFFAPKETLFNFREDKGFIGAAEICNGSGVCRKEDQGVMCPSYQATRDEKHSTRGRANALRSAMMGWLGEDGIAEQELYEIMDLCLSCQACKEECPSHVDMAKLKAEVLFAYYKKYGVPLRAQLLGRINNIYKLINYVPGIANIGMEVAGKQINWLLDIHPNRDLPRFNETVFSRWYQRRKSSNKDKKVIFFHDTFMENNDIQVGKAAIKVIEAAGFHPILLEEKKCCGRPALSKGLMNEVKKLAQFNINLLFPYAKEGIPIIGCEPSCISMLTNEYPDLFPGEKADLIAANTMCIDKFIMQLNAEENIEWIFDGKYRKILYHGHCHQKSNYGTEDTIQMLNMITNCVVEEIDAGCCGMAGSFGYEKEHYDLSIAIAEMRLAPAIRAAESDTIICASGTSCRVQIEHTTKRKSYHPIEIFAEALS